MFLIVTLLFAIFFVALRINQVIQKHHEERKERTDAINAIIHEYYHDFCDDDETTEYNYNYSHASLEDIDEVTETEEIDRNSNIISLARERNLRKYRK